MTGFSLSNFLLAVAVAVAACGVVVAAPATVYTWFGWRVTPTDYAVVHGKNNDPTENDFYLVCKGESGLIELNIRATNSGGYKSDMAGLDDVPTTFVFTKEHYPEKASLGPSEMLGGISIRYTFNRDSFTRGDDPILAAIARGEPFRVETPKTKTQLFSPMPARQFFGEMTSSCKPS
jgi:hypothetical protein